MEYEIYDNKLIISCIDVNNIVRREHNELEESSIGTEVIPTDDFSTLFIKHDELVHVFYYHVKFGWHYIAVIHGEYRTGHRFGYITRVGTDWVLGRLHMCSNVHIIFTDTVVDHNIVRVIIEPTSDNAAVIANGRIINKFTAKWE